MIPILTIAGSDCSGGAGVQADLKTFSAHGLFGMSVITSVVAENTFRVINSYDMSAQAIAEQIEAVFEDIVPKAVKIGMLSNAEIMAVVADRLKFYNAKNIVIDPVMYAKNGFALMDAKMSEFLIKNVLSVADLITPNIPEAEHLCGFEIKNDDDMRAAAVKICENGAKSVLVKGGHRNGASDFLYFKGEFFEYKTKFVATKNTHGTGCTLSSAIAANLALSFEMPQAVKNAKNYIQIAIENALNLGKGCGPTNHFYELYKKAGVL